MKISSFDDLWEKHPAQNDDMYPCWNYEKKKPNFQNQCAIRMSTCLDLAEADIADYTGVTCWFGCEDVHALRVEELAEYLETKLGLPRIFRGGVNCDKFKTMTGNRKGIIVFFDFWGKGKQGDHIDLWNGSSMTYGDPDYFERSRCVWFWELD